MGSLVIRRLDAPASELAARSRAWREPHVVLTVATVEDDALVIGEFQRRGDARDRDLPVLRRGSGGGLVRAARGSIWVQLALPRVDALVPCTADKILNRYVRPLLRGVTRISSVPTHYFGRDWISAAGRPVGFVGFAHDAESNAALFEAVVAVGAPFAAAGHPSFLGKLPATLEEVCGHEIVPTQLADAIVDRYAGLGEVLAEADAAAATGHDATPDMPWLATREEGIGTVACGRDESGRLRVGGELMASGDAIRRLEDALSALPRGASADDVGRIVDDTLTARGVVTFGIKSLESIRDVAVDVLRSER